MDNIIFHYCSLETLRLILTNKTLRLSSAFKMNDTLECRYLHNYLIQNKEVIYSKCTHLVKNAKRLDNLFSDMMFDSTNIFPDFRANPYLTCFTKHGDLLSQWRGYADQGKGVCLGFDRTVLEKYINQSPIELFDVIYADSRTIEQELVDIILDYIDNQTPAGDFESFKFTLDLDLFAPEFKHLSFSEEDEVRLCYYEGCCDKKFTPKIVEEKYFSHKKQFGTNTNGLVSFYDFQINNIKHCLRSITLGPRNPILVNDIDLLNLVASYLEIPLNSSICKNYTETIEDTCIIYYAVENNINYSINGIHINKSASSFR